MKRFFKAFFKTRPDKYTTACINGIYVPKDRKSWTDALDREVLKAYTGWR